MKTIQEILKPIQADFEERYNKQGYQSYGIITIAAFYNMNSLDFQTGVLLRYFRERGIDIFPMLYVNPVEYYFYIYNHNNENYSYSNSNPDYNIAFYEAIKKAVELVK